MKLPRVTTASAKVVTATLGLLVGACSVDPSDAPDSEIEAWGDAGGAGTIDAGGGPLPEDSGASTRVCVAGTWDHDGDPTTDCAGWTECEPGTYVTGAPSATADRQCAG